MENWLRFLLSKNADFEFYETEIEGKHVELMRIHKVLNEPLRIIDNPSKSRNEKLASLMRRLKMCEELGRGWDRMALACEAQFLPAPRIEVSQD